MDNYIRLLCTNNVHFHDLCFDFYSRCTPPLQFLENLALKFIHVWEATIKNVAIWSLYYDLRTLYQTREDFRKMLIYTIKRVKIACKELFLTPGGPIHLPIKYRNFAQSPFKAWAKDTYFVPFNEKYICAFSLGNSFCETF